MGCGILLVLGLACAPDGRPLIAEVFYDAAGADTGLEFVELFNPAAAAADLGGVKLESGDGSAADRWTTRWTAPPGTSLPGGARFVIGGAGVVPAPDTTIELSLQNGPDAVRLVWPDGAIEVVGYGALGFDEYFCGHPADDVPAGLSLARIPDTAHGGDNAADFRAAPPTPGRANQPRRHVVWVAGSLAIDPVQPAPGQGVTVSGRAVNAGADSLAPGDLAVRVALVTPAGDEPRARNVVARAAAPGETLGVSVHALAPEAGVHLWAATLELAGDESTAGTRDERRVRTGPGDLELTEIQFHPVDGEGEWVEARNRSVAAVDLSKWTLTDRGGTRGRIAPAAALEPDSLIVFAQRRDLLIAGHPALDSTRIVAVKPWASLNNSDDAAGIADAIALADSGGLAVDAAAYSAAGVPPGVPVERGADGRWRAALDPAGTPLAPSRAPAAVTGHFALLSPRVPAGATGARIAWSLPWREARIHVDAYDLAGDRARRVLGETSVAGRGERDVEAADLGPGLYVLVLEARPESGAGTLQATQVLRVDRRAP